MSIYEFRTYTLKPGTVAQAEKNFGEALPNRIKVSPLAAFWHTEMGPLNQIIHVWEYENLQHRADVRTQSVPGWPPKIQEFILTMESEILDSSLTKPLKIFRKKIFTRARENNVLFIFNFYI